MDGFKAVEWEKATKAQRIEHCRMAARETETFAEIASVELKPVYKELSASWEVLAAEMQQVADVVPANE